MICIKSMMNQESADTAFFLELLNSCQARSCDPEFNSSSHSNFEIKMFKGIKYQNWMIYKPYSYIKEVNYMNITLKSIAGTTTLDRK